MKKIRSIVFAGFLSLPLILASCGNGPQEKRYNITFLDEDQTQLSVVSVKEGEMPVYDKENPTKASTDQYDYAFKGWTPELVVATKDATYTATYSSTVRKYTITFYDEDGTTVLDSKEVEYGTVPTTSVVPTKASTNTKVYTFDGWDPTPVAVTREASYKATYSETTRKYTVKFVNGETVLQTESLEYGVTPSYKGDEPTKEAEEGITYKFDSWDKAIVPVDGDATYTAVFHEIDSLGICRHCNKFLDSTKVADYSIKDAKVNEIATPAIGFENVYGKASFDNGPVGIDLDISNYVTIYFALTHGMSYLYVYGGSDEYAKLYNLGWFQFVLKKDSDLNWHAYYKLETETTWIESKIDDGDKNATNLSSLLKFYNWSADERAAAQLLCSEIYASDAHEHAADDYGICKFCGILIDSEKACDAAVKDAQSIDEVAPRGFNSVSSISGLSNGNVGASFDVTKYKTLYFSLCHDISYIYLFGGNNSVNPTLWKDDWYNFLMIKESSGWIAYFKKSFESNWTTNKSKVDGATDQNFSSILRFYNWDGKLSSATVKCTEVYGILA